jgi:hypothetical protein
MLSSFVRYHSIVETYKANFICIVLKVEQGDLAKWLRREIRNLLGFARVGSNPAVVVVEYFLADLPHRRMKKI